jgi:hypothetical protein
MLRQEFSRPSIVPQCCRRQNQGFRPLSCPAQWGRSLCQVHSVTWSGQTLLCCSAANRSPGERWWFSSRAVLAATVFSGPLTGSIHRVVVFTLARRNGMGGIETPGVSAEI